MPAGATAASEAGRPAASVPEVAPASSPAAAGDDERAPEQGGEYRRVGGHNFITPLGMPTAFANSSVALVQGFGVYQLSAPSIELGVDPNTNAPTISQGPERIYNLLAYRQQLYAQIGILNRVSLDLGAGGAAVVGGDLETILLLGALADIGFGGTAKVRIFTADKVGFQLSAGAGVGYERILSLMPVQLLASFADPNNAKAVLTSDEWQIMPSVIAAEGIGPLGLQLAVVPEFGVAGSDDTATYEPTQGLSVGIHAAFDVHELTRYVPLAITGQYLIDHEFNTGDNTHTALGGLYYSGRRDFELGVVGGGVLVRPATGTEATGLYGQMVIHYFF